MNATDRPSQSTPFLLIVVVATARGGHRRSHA